jgi:hypothetical protein
MTTMNRYQQYLAAIVVSTFLIDPAFLRADCPDGGRTTSEAERQAYMAALDAIKNVPPAPAGWQLQLPRFGYTEAPAYTCKDMKLKAEYEVTYVSTEHQRLNNQRYSEGNARIAALQKLSPEEQNQVAEFTRQGSQLGYQARTAQKNKNPDEAARLFDQANEFYAKAGAIRKAHMEKVGPQVKAIRDDYYATSVKPEVKVHLAVSDEPIVASGSGVETVEIAGVPLAFFDRYKSLVMSFGRDAAGRNVRVEIQGVRELVLTVGRLFSESSLRALAAK